MEEENWGCPVIEEASPTPFPGNAKGSSTSIPMSSRTPKHLAVHTLVPLPTYPTSPPEGHWGYPIIEEIPLPIPLQDIIPV
jgi:hypothetical protein